MAKASRPGKNEALSLPRRLIGEVILTRGAIYGLESLALLEEPARAYCHNDTIGAIQLKLRAKNVPVAYDWSYGQNNETWGRAVLPPQDFFLDVDFEKVS